MSPIRKEGISIDRYIYPAVFDPDEGGYCVTFPDLPGCITEGDSLEEALTMAKDALALHLWSLEQAGDEIAAPSSPELIGCPDGAFVSLVEVWMTPVRDQMANRAIKKTLTIPKWLNDIAETQKVNFSQVLQNALKEYVGAEHFVRRQPD